MARDPEGAQDFYRAVLGWEFRAAPLGDAFVVAFSGGMPVAGIGALAHTRPIPVAWTPYFAVEDADATAARIRERVGTVAVGPMHFGTGRAAICADRDGAVFGVWQGEAIPDWEMGGAAAPAWLELRTRDTFDAAIFYGEVLEWACGHAGCCEVAYAEEAGDILLRHGTRTVARVLGGASEQDRDPHIRPRWHVHFRVPDPEAAVRAAEARGGAALPATSYGPGRGGITLRDPDGALFGIAPPGGPPGFARAAPVAAGGSSGWG
jgi:predicted enzyme related to lactoylglutathione lyase